MVRARAVAVIGSFALCGASPAGTHEPKAPVATEHRSNLSQWRQAAFNSAHTAHNRFERVLSPSNVSQLTQAWAVPVLVERALLVAKFVRDERR